MATKVWIGGAIAVAQVTTIQVTAFDAATTYTITIGGIDVSVTGDTDVNTTASNLQVALEASTHPYFEAITWTVATDTVTATAGTAGVPFEVSSSVTGGTGTIGSPSTTTASAGPSDWSTGDNWLNPATNTVGTGPVASDDVIIGSSSNNIAFGLDQNSLAVDSLRVDQAFTGRLGLNVDVFHESADGETTTDVSVREYRETYLKIDADVIDIGKAFGSGDETGAPVLKVHNVKAGASTWTIHNTASLGDADRAAVRIKNDNANGDLYIRSAPGGVAIAADERGETTSLNIISISDTSQNTRVLTSEGLTLTTWEQNGGSNVLEIVDSGTLTTLTVNGGTLTINGDFLITTLNVNGGIVADSHIPSSGNAITTVNLNGGTLSTRVSNRARTYATVNLDIGAILTSDSNLTITTLNEPSDPYSISVSAA